MSVYKRLGVAPVLNAEATLTALGGSVMAPEVVEAMADAARHFVDLEDLQRKAAAHVATLTQNQAAYITSGAAAGLVLATAACITGADPRAVAQLPDLTGLKKEVVIQRSHRNVYDRHILLTGARLVEVGDATGTQPDEFAAALGPDTAAVAFLLHPIRVPPGALDLATVLRLAHGRGVPVIVDAAAQLPPVENLWRLTAEGADLVVFSGGKDLGGPQASGLVVGREDLIAACVLHGNPRAAIGRPMKVGKEEVAGLVVAIERYVACDHAQRKEQFERRVAAMLDAFAGSRGAQVTRDFPNEAGQPVPRVRIVLDPTVLGWSRDEVVAALRQGQPSIRVASAGDDGFFINPMTLAPDYDETVIRQILMALTPRASISLG